MTVPVPGAYRLEYLTTGGWVAGHGDIALLDPQRYVDKMASRFNDKDGRGTWARVVEIDDHLRPTGVVYAPPGLPDPADAPFSRLMNGRITECAACGDPHTRAWECLT